ncbi:hypothetical protein GCM10022226_71230 [Sphaerisporangium flaviroseum]|uniref:Subtilisin inhibitor domain-containing protein n=2 Tax=Sphaerisporangium flaviroseum TaxID=509199 RepID=A0ABP7J9V9_9ACTN
MRRLTKGLTYATLFPATAAALLLTTAATWPTAPTNTAAATSAGASTGTTAPSIGAVTGTTAPWIGVVTGTTAPSIGAGAYGVAAIPRPLPGGPGAHSVSWTPQDRAVSSAPAKPVSRVLLLTVARGESPTPTDRVAFLECPATGGTHPKAAEACKQLERVSANLNDLNVSPDTRCTKEYDPVTVYGAGLWDTSRLSYERTFGNRCELRATTGAVFDF